MEEWNPRSGARQTDFDLRLEIIAAFSLLCLKNTHTNSPPHILTHRLTVHASSILFWGQNRLNCAKPCGKTTTGMYCVSACLCMYFCVTAEEIKDLIMFCFFLNQEMKSCQMAMDPLKATHYGVKVMNTQTCAHTNIHIPLNCVWRRSVSSDSLLTSFNPVSLTSALSVGAGLRWKSAWAFLASQGVLIF